MNKLSLTTQRAGSPVLLLLCWLLSLPTLAQTLTGKVTNGADNTALPGVTIVEKGSTKGTVTDSDGNYSLRLSNPQATVVLSYIGFVGQEIAVGGRSVLNVALKEDQTQLNEVVVTALGITKDKKALAYSVTEVKGSDFTQARETNVANALSGKIAGVNASGLSTGAGGSSRVIIRGNGSLNGNNQPLYVINGMPIDNTTPGGSPTTNGSGLNVDRGDGIGGINPDDIESISVLKGGTAAALYGSRAANGVILITTKKGRAQKGIGIDYNTTLMFDTPAVFPDFQYEYGQGDGGVKPTTQAQATNWGRRSWGTRMDGQPYIAFDGLQHPYSPQRNNIRNFYQTGSTFTNTVALNGGSENINFRFSLANVDNKSILPNSKFNRKIANLNVNAILSKRLSLETVAQYNLEQGTNRPSAGDAPGNPNWAVYMVANTVDIRQLSPGYDASGRETQWNETPYASNSYFVVNRFQNNDTKNRFIGQANLKFNILDNLYVRGSVSRDFYNFRSVGIIPTGTVYTANAAGEYHEINSSVSETNSLLTVNYDTKLGKNLGMTAFVGGNKRLYTVNDTYIDGTQFIIPFFYSYTNLSSLTTRPVNQKTATNSIFASADFDYKGIAFLTVTGRQDWFSTLSQQNNSIFYPSIGGSFVLSQAARLPGWISFAKVRASGAQVGGATPDPYILNQTYSMVQGGHDGRPLQQVTQSNGVNLVTNSSLRPLTSTTYELGLDMKFFRNRLGLDLTYYNRKTTDDIVRTSVSRATGYQDVLLNIGQVNNSGIEMLITGNPVKTRNFNWNVSYNLAYNKNEVVKLADGLNTIEVASSVGSWAFIHNAVGRPYGVIKGYTMVRDANNNVVYNTATGYPQRSALTELGQGVPPLTMGLSNTFTYKNFSLDVLIDGKFGNKIFSTMDVYATRFGLQKSTLPGRESGLPVSGVTPEGTPYSATIPVSGLRLYYDNLKNYTDLFLYDGSFVKLRQVVLNYNIPAGVLKPLRIQGASISLVARNPFILYRNTDNFDPESSYTNSNAQGFEAFSLPRTRSMGVNLMVKF
ncbi:TonB-linked SusC/RagA family outer membrane protein [Spirosoma oryzae]|uniref:TonB-linked SusC/RagA family outer membrane protein n=1 Tax=Spirosoma oryzae TaxID=1469603 RepID=A0A2T0TMW9_9BACT|nr:SusC/RagA family TonB-linked outer membrane protein [Spirosoma oryzae]PRY46961.1 TonB-linked SusC/RagA family outer membrane protein [Spirosoma oryzae]